MDLSLSLAGLGFHVELPDAEADRARRRYASYLSVPRDASSTAVRLTCTLDPSTPISQPAEVSYPGVRVTVAGDAIEFLRHGEHLRYVPSTRTATLTIDRLPSPTAAPSVEAALRILLSLRLVETDGLLLHAAGGVEGA